MTLATPPISFGNKKRLFVKLLFQLGNYGIGRGYEFTLGDGYRPDGHGHQVGSLHYVGLAQDLNLFILGNWVSTANRAWDDLGRYWKGLHPLCRWGGDFRSRDWNHFSLTYEGRALRRGKRAIVAGRETACYTPLQKKAAKREIGQLLALEGRGQQ